MTNELEEILNEIQFKTGLTLEQIAVKIGYTRPYLNKAKKSGGNIKLIGIIKETFPQALQNVTRETISVKSDDSYKEKYIKLLEKQLTQSNEVVGVSLNTIIDSQQVIAAHVKTALQMQVEERSKVSRQKLATVTEKTNRLVADYLLAMKKRDSADGAGS